MKRCQDLITFNTPSFPSTFEEKWINNILPIDVIQFIFSTLNAYDLQSTSMVSRCWTEITVSTSKEIFLNHFGLSFITENNIEFKNLNDIKSASLALKEHSLNLIKQLNEDDLPELITLAESIPTPFFFENYFALAPLFIRIEQAYQLTRPIAKNRTLKRNFVELIENGCIHSVKNFVKTNSHTPKRLLYMVMSELAPHDIKNAMEIADLITPGTTKNLALDVICTALSRKEEFTRVLDIIQTMTPDNQKYETFQKLISDLNKAGDFELAATAERICTEDEELNFFEQRKLY